MVTNQIVTLTPKDTNLSAFDISAENIITVVGINSDADSTVWYANHNRETTTLDVNETPTVLETDSEILFPATLLSDGSTVYINAERVRKIFANGSGSQVVVDTEGPDWIPYYFTESAAAIAALVTAIADTNPIPLASHITATTNSTSVASGALIVDGGVGIVKDVFIGGLVNVAGAVVNSDTTDSTSSVTGAVTTAGGAGIAKALFVGTTVNAGTALTVGTNQTFAKEVNHAITVTTTTTTATVGGNLAVSAGTGATSGAGGVASVTGGTGGLTGTGGAVNITSGAGGATSGNSGAVNVKSGAETSTDASGAVAVASGTTVTANSGAVSVATGTATTGNSGAVTVLSGAVTTGDSGGVTISTGNAGTGASGDITLSPGTASTIVGKIIASNAIIVKHKTAAINATATATAKEAATGYITSTSAAATVITLPTGTLLGAELGAAQGTIHKLYVDNTAGANTVTVAVAVDGILSASAAANAATTGLLTVPSGATGQAEFTLMFSSATTYTFSRSA